VEVFSIGVLTYGYLVNNTAAIPERILSAASLTECLKKDFQLILHITLI
jgi:hypothetical protein